MNPPNADTIQRIAAEAAEAAIRQALNGSGENAAPQPGPKVTRDLPTNIDGNPEFSNVILTLDHLQDAYGDDGHIRNKMIFSTESSAEVVAKLLAYYGEPLSVNSLARVLEVTGKAAETEYNGGILVLYFDKGNPNDQRGPVIEVVLSTVTYYGLVRHADFGKNSSLLASDALVRAVANALDHQKATGGFIPLLTYLQISEASFEDAAVEVRPAPEFGDLSASAGIEPNNSVTGGQGFTA